jgi:hypothetical protein
LRSGCEPPLLLLGRAHPLEHLHVAGVRRRAVEALRSQRVLAQLGGNVGVVQVGQALTGLGVGQEEVPQSRLASLGLGAIEQLQLTVGELPAVAAPIAERKELLGDRVDLAGDELDDRFVQRQRCGRHRQVERLVGRIT